MGPPEGSGGGGRGRLLSNLVPGLGFRLNLCERIKFNSFSFTLLRTKINVHRHTVSRHIQTAKTKKIVHSALFRFKTEERNVHTALKLLQVSDAVFVHVSCTPVATVSEKDMRTAFSVLDIFLNILEMMNRGH